MLFDEFAVNIRFHTHTDSAVFPDAEIVAYVNEFLPTLTSKINNVNNMILGVEATNDLVENQREYPIPVDSKNLVSVEAKLENEGTKWIWLENSELQIEDEPRDETSVIAKYANSAGRAKYGFFRGSLYILSGTIPSPDTLDGDNTGSDGISDGLKLWYLGKIEKITTTQLASSDDMSATPGTGATNWQHGIPERFHELLARYVRIKWKSGADRNIALDEGELLFDDNLEDALAEIRNVDKNKNLDLSPPDKSENWRYGYNL